MSILFMVKNGNAFAVYSPKDPANISNGKINSELVFKLYDTFGFPFEITKELAEEHNLTVNEKEFNELFEKHKEK